MDDRERDPKTDPVVPQEERELDIDVDETALEQDEELEDQ